MGFMCSSDTRSVSFRDLNFRKLKKLKRRKYMVKHHTLVHFFLHTHGHVLF